MYFESMYGDKRTDRSDNKNKPVRLLEQFGLSGRTNTILLKRFNL